MSRSSTPTRGLRYSDPSHRYWLDGRPVPGVTTILGVLDKPAIPKWAAAQVAEYVADHPDGVETLRQMGRGPMVHALKNLPWQKRDDAGTRGNVIHDYAEQLLHGREVEVDGEHIPVVESALAFMEDWRIKPLLIEAPVASREHHWAGTLDLIAEYVHPVTKEHGTAVMDWKSGRAIYPEFAWQLAAYGHAEFTGLGGDEVPIPACSAAFGVQIRADGYDVAPLAFGPHIYAEFVQIRRTYDLVKKGRGDWRKPGSGHAGIFITPPEEDTHV